MERKSVDKIIYKFENGVTLIYYKQNMNNTTQFVVGFVGGSIKDKKKYGTAHFLEHMLSKECPKISETKFHKFVRDNNIETNAFTSENYLVLYADTPNSHLSQICEIYRQLLSNKHFNKKSIDMERKAINQEILIEKDFIESDKLEKLRPFIQKNYRHKSILGSIKTISTIDEKVLQNYIANNFVSENMVISVVSNLDFETIKENVESKFVYLFPSNPKLKNNPVKAIYYPYSNYFEINYEKDLKTVNINISYFVNQTEKEKRLFSIVEDYMFNGFSGKLLKKLRSEKGLVYYADFENVKFPNNLVLKTFNITTSKKHVNEAIYILGNIIDNVVKYGMSEKEFEGFKNMIESKQERYFDLTTANPLTLLDRFVEGEEIFYGNQLEELKRLSLKDINDYLRKAYNKKNIFVEIDGNFNRNTLYNVNEIENRLHSYKSKYYFEKNSQLYLSSKGKIITDENLLYKINNDINLDSEIGFVDGNYLLHIINKKIKGLHDKEKKDIQDYENIINIEYNKDNNIENYQKENLNGDIVNDKE